MKKFLMTFLVLISLLTFISVSADDLTDVQKSGVLRLGVPPEYIPFVFFDDAGNNSGLDVALVEEIGRRMGVRVQVYNLAFDGLIDSLDLGQVDIIGGAFDKTEERQRLIDFTRVYYSGNAQFIGLSSLSKPASVSMESFRDLKIGVQKGTSFDQWVKTNLVSAGYVSNRNVYTYANAADEIRALDRKDVDLIVLSQDIYEDLYKPTGKYQIFYEGFIKENYAYGLRKNSSLTSVVNQHLTDMIKDGTAQSIANRFFSRNYREAETNIYRESTIPTATPNTPVVVIPAQNQSANCKNGMVFVSDVTITDGHVVGRGEQFRKIWRVRNTGSCTWTPNYTFVFVSGDQMSGRNISIPTNVAPNATVDLAVDLVGPSSDGTFKGYWQMRSPQGMNFGETIWVKVRVNGGGSGGGNNPYLPVINAFYPDFYAGPAGTCPTVYWQTSNTAKVEITVDNMSMVSSYSANGAQQICGPLLNTGSHTVQIAALSSTDTSYASFVYTSGGGQQRVVPSIKYFYPDSNSGTEGNCVTVYWSVDNAAIISVDVDGENVKNSYDATATRTICGPIMSAGTHTVTLTARSSTDERSASFTYNTNYEEGQHRVVPNIEYFYVDPDQGEMGQSTTAYWGVSNAASVDVFVDGNQIERNQSPYGSCPIQATIQSVGMHEIVLRARSVTDDVYSTVYYQTIPENGGWAGSNYRD